MAVKERTLLSRTTTRSVPSIKEADFQALRGLTLMGYGGNGSMRPKVDSLRKEQDEDSWATYLRDVEGTIVGWALTFHYFGDRYDTYFFVNPDLRRQGIGTRLYRSVRRRFGVVRVHPWSPESRGFFARVQG